MCSLFFLRKCMIYENQYYKIEIIVDDPDQYCYAVVNKELSTVEHKGYTLPASVAVADQLARELERLQDKLNPSKAEVVSIRKPKVLQ